MLVLTLIVGIAFAVVATLAFAQVYAQRREGKVVEQIASYGFSAAAPEIEAASSDRPDIATALGEFIAKRRKGHSEPEIRRKLVAAGIYDRTPRQFVGYQVIGLIVMFVLWLVIGIGGDMPNGLVIVGLVLFSALGWFAPKIILDRKIKTRFDAIDRRLPELVDLLVVSVEAGMSFNASLHAVGTQLDGPLAQEIRLTLQEQNMGLTMSEALKGLGNRVDTPGIRSFVRSIIQGEALGVSIGQNLRNVAGEMRKRRKASAEERAQKAPIKMLFPLVFLIFPALFVVLLVPALISIWQQLG